MIKVTQCQNYVSKAVNRRFDWPRSFKTPLSLERLKVDRVDFVLPEYQAQAYEDHPLPIGFGQTISQPYTVALMLEWLAPKQGDKI